MAERFEKAMLKALGQKPKSKKETDQQYRTRLMKAGNKLADDDFDALSENCQNWLNDCVNADNVCDDLPDLTTARPKPTAPVMATKMVHATGRKELPVIVLDLKEIEWVKVLEVPVPLVWLAAINMLRPVEFDPIELHTLALGVWAHMDDVKKPSEHLIYSRILEKIYTAIETHKPKVPRRPAKPTFAPNNKQTALAKCLEWVSEAEKSGDKAVAEEMRKCLGLKAR
jgi:hypothetical protein